MGHKVTLEGSEANLNESRTLVTFHFFNAEINAVISGKSKYCSIFNKDFEIYASVLYEMRYEDVLKISRTSDAQMSILDPRPGRDHDPKREYRHGQD